MLHPHAHRLELSFPLVADSSLAGWWLMNVVFGLAFALYAWASFWILWGEPSWTRVEVFAVISAVFWGSFLGNHPLRVMVIQELVIDTSTDTITARGLVHGRSVVVTAPIAAVTEVKYWEGSMSSQSPNAAELELRLSRPYRTMRFPRLAPRENDLCDWICTMLRQPLATK